MRVNDERMTGRTGNTPPRFFRFFLRTLYLNDNVQGQSRRQLKHNYEPLIGGLTVVDLLAPSKKKKKTRTIPGVATQTHLSV